MMLSASQQVALAFTAVLFTFVVLPRMFGVGGGGNHEKDLRLDSRFSRKGPGPSAVRGNPVHMNSPGAQSAENLQNMKTLMEQELKSDKYKSNNNKGYVFTLMPLYAIGVGVFAAYKFLKIKSADDHAQKDRLAKGAKKSVEAEKQLNELEQRLAQTERMLNSILTQLDPLTNCVKSVAQDQKNEIMNQLQTIRHLMKKRGMDCPPLNIPDGSCERNLNSLIESLGAKEMPVAMPPISEETPAKDLYQKVQDMDKEATEEQDACQKATEDKEQDPCQKAQESDKKAAEGELREEEEQVTGLEEDVCEEHQEEMTVQESGLRRRNRPE
ncbi:unnamed protein product [Knipowitschia caucasica]|uniref:Resistance to inhibitors of cholinesterase protein 3 N-terminal domain-containing protein n=2 Tax=Knipowitschia caucasica TaxID=637954 RepID=A0AAV2IYA1_KNICA